MAKNKKTLNLTAQIMIAVVLGGLFGYFLSGWAERTAFLGEIFLRLIQMGIVLLILGQMVAAMGSLEIHKLGRIGLRTIVVFLVSSTLASAWGVLFAAFFQPGKSISGTVAPGVDVETVQATFSELLIGFFPTNIMQSLSEGTIVHIVVFGAFFGIALSLKSSEGELSILKGLKEFNGVILKMIELIMKLAPIGIFSLIASTISKYGINVVRPLLSYLLIYACATLLFLIVWEVVVSVYCRVPIVTLTRKMGKMSLIALASTSSAVALPTALEDSQKKLGMSKEVSTLVLPLGMSLNSNGAAMFMALTLTTIGQIYGAHHGMNDFIFIAVLATLTSLASAVVPGGGLIALSIVVPQMGLPIESIAIFAGVEWFTGMIRTILNVNSDVFSGLVVAKSVDSLDRDILLSEEDFDPAARTE
ncbi:dicarboxylate/amino acid:cation symporter [Saccharibacillus sp. CPCC 101409]|uniref:dicarboxylate/amino acid:cation symporter n=1 Tax=Saccharibacillus sp. CPCC 101409 TaxID=3058041 RepID=UPI0026723B54|nr:dicarboxylate/amino acid:cation symporter [Saccharibacillus sp. CPCC 101409]MDO3410414.1 dicarboxylate/amino acid:cation symporter [Saccharibacillus sp. CPCC 101409]